MLRALVLQFGDDWQAKLDLMELPILTAIILTSGWHHLRHFMGKLVEYLCVGLKLVKDH